MRPMWFLVLGLLLLWLLLTGRLSKVTADLKG